MLGSLGQVAVAVLPFLLVSRELPWLLVFGGECRAVEILSVSCMILVGAVGGRVVPAATCLMPGRNERPGAPPPMIFRSLCSAF